MNKIVVSKLVQLYELEGKTSFYDEIVVEAAHLKGMGILRYVFKFALLALNDGGILRVHDAPAGSFSLSRGKIDFWQVRYELFKIAKSQIEVLDVDSTQGQILVKKVKESKQATGFSFGIVFSGVKSELESLYAAIDSVISNDSSSQYPYEIIICGPTSDYAGEILARYVGEKVRYLAWDKPSEQRFLVSQKKNHLLNNCAYSVAVISHVRILFPSDFMRMVWGKSFDICTPKVVVVHNNMEYDYLDFGLIGSYIFDQHVKSKSLTSVHMNKRIYDYMKNRVPYIDGGITIYNLNVIKESLLDDHIAWGEAEDIDMSARAYHSGLLLTYMHDVKCISSTIKNDYKLITSSSFKCKLIRLLVRLGLI